MSSQSPRLPSRHRHGLLALLLLAVMAGSPAWAQAGTDCAPVGSMPNYPAGDAPTLYAYNSENFNAKKGDNDTTVPVAGRYCRQAYQLKEGGEPISVLETQSNFRDQLGRLGAQVVYTDDNETDARLVKDGKETWVKVVSNGESDFQVVVVGKQPFADTLAAPTDHDYPLLGHLSQYVAEDPPMKRNFDQDSFSVQDADAVNAQGAKYVIGYSLKPGGQASSVLDAQMTYRAALQRLGAQIVFAGDDETDARFDKQGQAVWVRVANTGPADIKLTVVEEKAFQSTIQPARASELKTALDKDGHVALYINFDFDKVTLRPDTAPVIAQVVALLKDNPDLKLSVEGNTDNVGGRDYNVKLSQDRAAAVVAGLVSGGITADRLNSAGNGPDKPIVDNASSEGRAKNRRVELVKA